MTEGSIMPSSSDSLRITNDETFVLSWNAENEQDLFRLSNLQPLYISKISRLLLPLFASRVAAGFPSPADDYIEASLDLNNHLIQHPAATFFVRASGSSMTQAGIHNNDILVVDRSLEPKHGSIIIAALNGELTIKRLHIEGKNITLKPENPNYPSIIITEEIEFLICGVVTFVIHELRGMS